MCIRTFIHKQYVWCVRFSPDQKYIISSSQDGTIKVWNILENKCVKTINKRMVEYMNFAPDNTTLFASGIDVTIYPMLLDTLAD